MISSHLTMIVQYRPCSSGSIMLSLRWYIVITTACGILFAIFSSHDADTSTTAIWLMFQLTLYGLFNCLATFVVTTTMVVGVLQGEYIRCVCMYRFAQPRQTYRFFTTRPNARQFVEWCRWSRWVRLVATFAVFLASPSCGEVGEECRIRITPPVLPHVRIGWWLHSHWKIERWEFSMATTTVYPSTTQHKCWGTQKQPRPCLISTRTKTGSILQQRDNIICFSLVFLYMNLVCITCDKGKVLPR